MTLLAAPALEHKTFTGPACTKVLDSEAGVVEAIVAATGNVDDGGDLIEPGAFSFPVGRLPKVAWHHDITMPVGKVLDATELLAGDLRLPDEFAAAGMGGLLFKMAFDLQDPDGFKAYRKVKFHDDIGWSIGYEVPADGQTKDKAGVRHLTKVVVWEASPVSFGMNAAARTMSVKSTSSPIETKSSPPVAGSYEETMQLLNAALEMWGTATHGERSSTNSWWVWVDSTFADRVIARHGQNGDPEYLSFGYRLVGGAAELAPPEKVDLATVITGASSTDTAAAGQMSREPVEETKSHDADTLSVSELLAFESLAAGA